MLLLGRGLRSKHDMRERERQAERSFTMRQLAVLVFTPLLVAGFSYTVLSNSTNKQIALPVENWTMFQKDSQHTGYVDQDVSFGDVLWTYEEFVNPWGYSAFGTSVNSQEVVFVESYRNMGLAVLPPHVYYILRALDAESGETLWTFEKIIPGFETHFSPLLLRDTVVVGNLQEVVALDIDDGSTVWTFSASQEFSCHFGSPVSVSDIVAVGCNYGWWDSSLPSRLYVLSSSTGKEIWNTTFENYVGVASVDEASIFVSDFTGRVFSFNLGRDELWNISLSEHVDTPLTLDGDFIYLGSKSGAVYILDKTSGDIVWESTRFGEIRSSFAVSPDSFYFVTLGGSLYAFDKNDRTEIWNLTLNGCTMSSPVLGRNALVVPSGNHIYFIKPSNGEILWEYQFTKEEFPPPRCVSSTASISNNLVVFPSNAGKVIAFTSKNPNVDSHVMVLLLSVGIGGLATIATYVVYRRLFGKS